MNSKSIQHLVNLCSGKHVPTSATEFVGAGSTAHGAGAYAVALQLERAVQQARACNNAALKILLNGTPGIGKSALALYCGHLLGCNKWSTTRLNGTKVKIEKLEEIEAALHYKNLFGDYRLVNIEEADAIPSTAQINFLTMLDDLPDGVAVICTSNCKVADFQARFQTRFQVFELIPPTAAEIEALLCDYVDPREARNIATFCGGNVRSALLDAKGLTQNQALALA